ncbi:Uncharacterised protein [Actinomyces bovis]|uniref:WXG100 family type VII secretion target n=1 Tax=Actinomyces bovis TaxID=1658 RepID=A0ABY1VNJ6_9ACTO|nr:hypothetical protein [Actinomyces bovis]SPT53620.1 Uncharacterised protein [Actinomyces bovis]VEG55671.1 Uncharacterised protein [Actinomyces israelii]
MANVNADLSTLETLYDALKGDVDSMHSVVSNTDTALKNAVWQSPNAQAFRDSWTDFRPKLIKMEMATADAANDVAKNHSDLVAANGVTDARELPKISSYDVI